MTVSKEYNKHIYEGNGLTTDWPYDFDLPITAAGTPDTSLIHVFRTNLRGEVTEVTPFSVDAETGTLTYPTSGSPMETGEKLTILRLLDVRQQFFDPSNQANLYPETLEDNTDRLVMMVQQVADDVARSIKVPVDRFPTEEDVDPLPILNARDEAVGAADSASSSANTAVDAAQQADAARATCIQERILTQDASQQTADDRRNTTAHVGATAAWAQLAMTAVDIPEWDVGIPYSFPDTVLYTDGHTYRCISSVAQIGDVPGASTSWARITYDASNILEEHGSYPSLAKNAMTLEDTLWVNSKYGITWNDAGYLTVFETLAKTLLHPDSLYLRQDDPDMLGDLVIGGSATIKYDRKRNRLNICASGESAVVYSDDPVYIDGDTCGPVTLLNGVTLAVNVGGDLALTVSGVPETAPPDTFLSSGTYKELLHIGSGVAVTNIEFIEVDSPVSLAADAYGIYSAEFIEDETVTYSKFSLGAATFPNMKEVA